MTVQHVHLKTDSLLVFILVIGLHLGPHGAKTTVITLNEDKELEQVYFYVVYSA